MTSKQNEKQNGDMNDRVRVEFETIYLGNNPHVKIRNEVGDYVYPSIQDAWAGWKAAYKYLLNQKTGEERL